jgi:hypothetical protein
MVMFMHVGKTSSEINIEYLNKRETQDINKFMENKLWNQYLILKLEGNSRHKQISAECLIRINIELLFLGVFLIDRFNYCVSLVSKIIVIESPKHDENKMWLHKGGIC